MKNSAAVVFSLCLAVLASAQSASPDLTRISDAAVWRVHNRSAKLIDDAGRQAVQLDAKPGGGVAWLVGSDFSAGTIDIDLRGKNMPQQSFIGVAFRGADDETYDAIYFRPFNFKSDDVPRRARSVQYISMPKFDWPKLREEHPGKYEAAVSPVPDPDGWFHARIVVENRKVSVFVNDSPAPSLVVIELSDRRGGRLGLWVGNGSDGAFANLKITPQSN